MIEDNTHLVYIKGDWNDADYVYRFEEVTDLEIPLLQKMAQYFKACGRQYPPSDLIYDGLEYCWDKDSFNASKISEYVTLEEYETFDECFVPCGYEGSEVHTIESIVVIPIQHVKKIL